MFFLVVFTLGITVVALALYLLLVRKYYWGPKGAPKQDAAKRRR
ncbi:MAG TPA: hypothetical protein VGV59_11925 [Pyrinomonadaceae bacterium]|nr:hypothetical protein [Pyrinomonadaceae bacterium]